jgi:hypothetical protein
VDSGIKKDLSLDNLRKRYVIVMDRYCMCKKCIETLDLLLHHEVAKDLWVLTFHLFGLEWIMPQMVLELLACWRGQLGSRHRLEASRMSPLCLMYCI